MRPLRGSRATTTAPAVGTKVVSVRMELVSTNTVLLSFSLRRKVRRESKVDGDKQDGGTNCEPACVGANIARLHALNDSAESLGRQAGGKARAVDDSAVEESFEDIAREEQQRGDDHGAVDLVDPVLIEEQLVEAAELCC